MPNSLQSPEAREFVKLLTNLQGVLHSFIISLMPGQPDSADVLQETNLKLWEKMGDYQSGSNFRAWVFRIARYKVFEHLRKARKSHLMFLDEEILDRLGQIAEERDTSLYDAKLRALAGCLEELSPKNQELVRVHHQSGSTLKEYARGLGRPVTSLYVTLGRLRTVLKRCVESRIRQEGGLE